MTSVTDDVSGAVAAGDASPAKAAARDFWVRPLRFHLNVIIITLLVATAATLVALSYFRGRALAISGAATRMEIVSARIGERYVLLYAAAAGFVEYASVAQAFATPPPQDEAAKFSFLREALHNNPHLNSAYVGYPDGEFVQLVELASDRDWAIPLGVPAEARFAARAIASDAEGKRQSTWRFFSSDGTVIAALSPRPATYDPRGRPWYQEALGSADVVVTDPYIMATTRRVGVTVARAHTMRSGVVAGTDLLLGTIDDFLAAQRISPGAEAFVFDGSGTLISSSRGTRAAQAVAKAGTEAAPVPAAMVEGLLLSAVRAAIGSFKPDGTAWTFEQDGRTYMGMLFTPEATHFLAGDRVAMVAPIDELTADSLRLLQHGLLVSAVVLGLGILGAFVVGKQVSRSLGVLTRQARRLKELDFVPTRRLNSHIWEIAQLDEALHDARGAIRTFGLYVPKELVRRIIGERQFVGRSARRQTVTALFTDIRDFTTICERNEAEQVVAMLSAYFDLISGTVQQHGGAIIQFLGDSVFAMWNAPIPDERHANHACTCALALKAGLEAFNAEQSRRGLPEFVTRIGVHLGEAVVGSVGAEDRFQYTAMGDTVNLASRLEGLNKEYGTTILVSGAVVSQVAEGAFTFRLLGSTRVKGRGEPIEVSELVAAGDAAATKQPAGPPSADSPDR